MGKVVSVTPKSIFHQDLIQDYREPEVTSPRPEYGTACCLGRVSVSDCVVGLIGGVKCVSQVGVRKLDGSPP